MDRTPTEHLLCARRHSHCDGSEAVSLTPSLHSSRSASPESHSVSHARISSPVSSTLAEPLPDLCCCRAVTKSCLTLCNLMDYSMPGFPVLHRLPEFARTPVHQVGDAIQPSHPLLPASPLAPSLTQNQGLFQ